MVNLTEWQPIETAPRDGRLLVLCWSDWDGQSRHYQPVVGWWQSCETLSEGGEWVQWSLGLESCHGVSHWMALPPGPEDSDD